jgi:hypothetical protein
MTTADEASPAGEPGAVGLGDESDERQPGPARLVVRGQGGMATLSPGPVYRIGRDPDADVVVDGPVVSWWHAQLLVTAGQWLIQDTGSTNGTFSGGRQIRRMGISGTVQFRLGHPEDGPLLVCSVAGAVPAAPADPGPAPASSGTCRYLAATLNCAASAAAASSSPTPAAATAPSSTASGSPPRWLPRPT